MVETELCKLEIRQAHLRSVKSPERTRAGHSGSRRATRSEGSATTSRQRFVKSPERTRVDPSGAGDTRSGNSCLQAQISAFSRFVEKPGFFNELRSRRRGLGRPRKARFHSTATIWCSATFGATKDRKSTRLNSSHSDRSRMPSSA